VRVTWVHPSWRDLVIDELVRDAGERRRFLAQCGVDGAALALSHAGGTDGDRGLPLLKSDADWDALGDGLYRLCPELDDASAARLLSVLAGTERGPERDALVAMVLERLRKQFDGRAVAVDALEAWFALGGRSVEPLPMAATWVELEPLEAPSTPAELETFADWLRLAELMMRYDGELLDRLGFPARHREILDRFCEQTGAGEPPQEAELRRDARQRLGRLDPFRNTNAPEPAIEFEAFEFTPPLDLPLESFSVARVLRDLE
jgi:hypothetical protein